MKRGDVRMARGFTVLELLLTVTVGALVTVAGTGLYRWSRQQADIAVSSRNLRQLAAASCSRACISGLGGERLWRGATGR